MKQILTTASLVFMGVAAWAQNIYLNEGSNRNATLLMDEDGDYPDWIELYNADPTSVNLSGYYLSDAIDEPDKWQIQGLNLDAGGFAAVFCSGKDRNTPVDHWETAIDDNTLWRYLVPNAGTAASWNSLAYSDALWSQGYAGFGYGDGDDATTLTAPTTAVYIRSTFNITDTAKIGMALLHVDYDDGFIAYLNGVEIARSNMSLAGWNTFADGQHEAAMYTGGNPESFVLDMNTVRSAWQQGSNVLAIEAHNVDAASSDLSVIPFLSFGINDASTFFNAPPAWFGSAAARFHTNFKISSSGETVYLFDAALALVDSLYVGNLQVDYSNGRTTDGSAALGVFTAPTPEASNNTATAYNGYAPQPVLSVPAGFYSGFMSLSMSCSDPNAQIRYTLDGQEPTATSPLYVGSIIIFTVTVVKAKAFSTTGLLPSPSVTATYFLNSQYQHTVPVISMTMNDADLYGANGIYDNWWTDWKKQCHIEYFDASGQQLQFAKRAAAKIEGGAGGSRSQPQRSFRIEMANGIFGDGALEQFPLMASRPDRLHWDAFYLRNGSNMYNTLPFKDAIQVEALGKGIHTNYQAYNCVAVYLNGQFWGIYEMREKQDVDYFEQNYGADRDSLNLMGLSYWYGSVLREVHGEGGMDDFWSDYNQFLSINTNDLDYWNQINQKFDMLNYSDYIAAQLWVNNVDWPQNNIKIYRANSTGGRWRFGLIDLELSFNPYGWTSYWDDNIGRCLTFDPNNPYIHLWQQALQNNTYHDYFINRFADLMNTSYLPDTINTIAQRIYNEAYPEMGYQHERWGDTATVSVADFLLQLSNLQDVLQYEFAQRSPIARNQIQGHFNLPQQVSVTLDALPAGAGKIKISTISPSDYPWTGIYFDGVPVKIEAIPNFGYAFSHWDNNGLITNTLNSVFSDTININNINFTAHFQQAFPISTAVTISEINYNSEPSRDAGDWIEFWNYDQSGTADLTGWYFTDDNATNVFNFSSGTSLAPNQRIVVARDTVAFKAQFPLVPVYGQFGFGLGSTTDAVRLYNNVGQLMAEVVYADTLPWASGADGYGYTLELESATASPFGAPSNWFNGCLGGSPGQPFTPCNNPVIFSEINYKGNLGINCGDWVEIRNISGNAINLTGWTFKDGVDSSTHIFTFPNFSLPASGNVVVAEDLTLFNAAHASVSNAFGSTNFGFSSTGEWLRLYDNTGLVVQTVRYDNNSPWATVGDGYTLEILDSLGLQNDGSNWFEGCYGGSPAAYYNPACPTGVTEIQSESGLWAVFPNPSNGFLTVLYTGNTSHPNPQPAQVFDALGRQVHAFSINANSPYSLDIRHLTAGNYWLRINQNAVIPLVINH